MKKLLIAFIFIIASFTSFAGVIKAEKEGSAFEILERVINIKSTYSQSSDLEAKVIELLAGDGFNPTRAVIIFRNGLDNSKIFELDTMFYSVDRITFSDIDTLVINYTQDSIDEISGDSIQVKKSVQVKVLRNSNGQLSDDAVVTNLK